MADKIIIAVVGLLVVVGVLVARKLTQDRNKRGLSNALVKLYGLLSISALGVLLASATNIQSPEKTAGITLLATIAGFIAGKDVPDEDPPDKQAHNHTTA
jgi:hypothetical protein